MHLKHNYSATPQLFFNIYTFSLTVLFALLLGCLSWWWQSFCNPLVYCSFLPWRRAASYIPSSSVLAVTIGRFSSVSPKLNLCSSSAANKGTTWPTGHSVVRSNQYDYEDLCWRFKILPVRSDWRGAFTQGPYGLLNIKNVLFQNHTNFVSPR